MSVKPLPASLRQKLLSNKRPMLLAPDEIQPLLDFIYATPADARRMLWDAQERLKELGWKEAMYCPKDGRMFEVIEPGSTGVHKCSYDGEWPTGSYWVHSEGDLWPSHPLMFRPLPSNAGNNRSEPGTGELPVD